MSAGISWGCRIVAFVALLCALPLVGPRSAAATNYYTTSLDEGRAYNLMDKWYGVSTVDQGMAGPYVTPGSLKVTSIGANSPDEKQWVEMGWDKGNASPMTVFTARVINGAYAEHLRLATMTNAYHGFTVRWSSSGSQYWDCYFDGTFVDDWYQPYLSAAYIGSQAEVHNTADNNWAHFTQLKGLTTSGWVWDLWFSQYQKTDDGLAKYYYKYVSAYEWYNEAN
jgi:hypothetical protein